MKKILSLFVMITTTSYAAIFGVDDRISINRTSPGYELSRSTAVAVLSSNFEVVSEDTIKLNLDKLDEWFCPSVKFVKQPSLSYACSGFLVAPDLIVTAGHCMVNTGESRNETQTYCKGFSWLFDFTEEINPQSVPKNNLYSCKQVIYAVKDENNQFRDYALVQLDRPVTGRRPLKLSAAPLKANETFSMIGHPFGLPAKLSRNAKIILNDVTRESFLTSLDAFGGNSGSAVFNKKNEVVGILVGGTPSANTLTTGGCEILNRCNSNGKNCLEPDKDTSIFPGYQGVGSEVQRIAPLMKLMRKLQ